MNRYGKEKWKDDKKHSELIFVCNNNHLEIVKRVSV